MIWPARIAGAGLAVVASLAFVASANAAKGDGSLRIEYQFLKTGAFDSSIGDIDIGSTDGHALMFSGQYALTDRWTVTASLPYIRKRHRGALPHDPVADFTNFQPQDLRLIDDGDYHGGWQDLYVGASYLAIDGPITVQPFVAVGVPTTDYPFYGHAAIGRNLWHVPVGAAFAWQPLFSDFHFSGDVAYVFTEKTLGVDISHWLIHAEASYYLTDSFIPKLFVTVKHGTKGLAFPDDFDLTDLDNAEWYYHDRTIKHNFVNAGFGFDWQLSERYQASATWFKMVDPEQVNILERAWTVSLTYFFAGED